MQSHAQRTVLHGDLEVGVPQAPGTRSLLRGAATPAPRCRGEGRLCPWVCFEALPFWGPRNPRGSLAPLPPHLPSPCRLPCGCSRRLGALPKCLPLPGMRGSGMLVARQQPLVHHCDFRGPAAASPPPTVKCPLLQSLPSSTNPGAVIFWGLSDPDLRTNLQHPSSGPQARHSRSFPHCVLLSPTQLYPCSAKQTPVSSRCAATPELSSS